MESGDVSEMSDFNFNIWPFFDSSCYKGFTDDPAGFYAVYSGVFDLIVKEEEDARMSSQEKEDWQTFYKAPKLGNSTTPIEEVLKFYSYWENFRSAKSFGWADMYYQQKEAARYMKRAIDKENKKERAKARKKYMETIQELVLYVKHRDPRFKKYKDEEKKKKAEKELEQKIKKEEEKKRLQEARELHKLEEMKLWDELERDKKIQDEANKKNEKQAKISGVKVQHDDSYDEEEKGEFFDCELCSKSFKSENQLKNHFKSKMHQTNMKSVLKDVAMQDEKDLVEDILDKTKGPEKDGTRSRKKKKKSRKGPNDDLKVNPDDIPEIDTEEEEEEKIEKEKPKTQNKGANPNGKGTNASNNQANQTKTQKEPETKSQKPPETKKKATSQAPQPFPTKFKSGPDPSSEEEEKFSDSDDDIDMGVFMSGKRTGGIGLGQVKLEEEVKEESEAKRNKGKKLKNKEARLAEVAPVLKEDKGLNKAKLKKLKKQEANSAAGIPEGVQVQTCRVCAAKFDSKTKVFNHLRDVHKMK